MFSDYNTPTKHTHTSLTHLKIRDVELVVGGQDVGACGGHVHLIPCLLASLIARSRNQPELSHGCKSPVFSCPITTRICKKKKKYMQSTVTQFCTLIPQSLSVPKELSIFQLWTVFLISSFHMQ